MKHTFSVTLILIGVFVLSQLLGLGLIAAGTDVATDEHGNVIVSHEDTVLGARPETSGIQSFTYLIVGVAVGTAILLILARFKLVSVWKLWFFVAVWLASSISLGALMNRWIALVLAFALAAWKVWRPNIYVHNLTEVLVYSGIALLIAPILDLFYATLLLIVIAVYDAYAVWKSKHMVAMAEFQTETKSFAGLIVPYERKMKMAPKPTLGVKSVRKVTEGKNAILGGGDIAFPMLFAGVVMDTLIQGGIPKLAAYGYSLVIVVAATAALAGLFFWAKPDKFYPAMPFITAGCFVGYGVVALLL